LRLAQTGSSRDFVIGFRYDYFGRLDQGWINRLGL